MIFEIFRAFYDSMDNLKMSWWYLERFKSYSVNRHTITLSHTYTNRHCWTIPPPLRRRCAGPEVGYR